MKHIAITLLALFGCSTLASAQVDAETPDQEFEATADIDIISHYVWRGTDMGAASIQPTGTISWRGASLSLSGSTGLHRDDDQEIDVTLGYQAGPFNIGLTDYWQTGCDFDGRDLYFSYDQEHGAHQLEGNIGYTCQYFSLQAYTMIWGNDFKYQTYEDALARENGKRAFSTYIELHVPFYMCGLDWDLRGGITPFESANTIVKTGETDGKPHYRKDHFYANGATCVLASVRATKNFEIGDVKTPAFLEFVANPYLRKAYFLVGVSIKPF